MSADLLCCAEQFIDIAFAIPAMDTASWVTAERRRLSDILQPAKAFFFFNRHACRIDFSFQGIGTFKLAPAPELDRGQPQRQTVGRDRQTGMHPNATNDGMEGATFLASPHKRLMKNAKGGSVLPGKGEPGRVMQNQNGCRGSGQAASCGLKMAGQDRFFLDFGVRQKAIGRFRMGPILTGKGNAFAQARRELLQQLLQAPVPPLVRKGAAGEFLVDPFGALLGRAANG